MREVSNQIPQIKTFNASGMMPPSIQKTKAKRGVKHVLLLLLCETSLRTIRTATLYCEIPIASQSPHRVSPVKAFATAAARCRNGAPRAPARR